MFKIYLVIINFFFYKKKWNEIEVDRTIGKFPRLFGLLYMIGVSFAL